MKNKMERLTLRDLRRVASKKGIEAAMELADSSQPNFNHMKYMKNFGWKETFLDHYIPSNIESIDKAISKLGPDFDIVKASRDKKYYQPKDTDLVDGKNKSGDQSHGGDHASGEVKDSQNSFEGGENENNLDKNQGGAVIDAQDDSEDIPVEDIDLEALEVDNSLQETARNKEPGAASGSADDEPENGESTAKAERDGRIGSESSKSDELDVDPAVARDLEEIGETDVNQDYGERNEGEATSASRSEISNGSCSRFGGVFATAKSSRIIERNRDAKQIAKLLKKVFAIIGTGLDESPRIDGRRLIKEIVSKRYNLSRSVRREIETGLILLMADVSGSCSAAAPETVSACIQLTKELPNTIFVVHSNGYPEEVYYNGKEEDVFVMYDSSNHENLIEWWNRFILEKYKLQCAINFGDWDAGDILEIIASKCPLIWLDSYAACSGVKPVSEKGYLYQFMDWKVKPLGWYQGVNDASSAKSALEHFINKRG